MNEPELRTILKELGIPVLAKSHDGWLTCTCPFAKWKHKNGTDRNPSFGIKIESEGFSGFNCFSCKEEGTVAALVRKLEHWREESYGSLSRKADSIERAKVPPDFDFNAESKKPPEPINDSHVAGMFPLASEEKQAMIYLEGRGISAKTARLMGLLYDPDEFRILFPVRDYKHRLFGWTGRTILHPDRWPDPKPGCAPYDKVKNYAGIKKEWRLLGEDLIRRDKELPIIVVEGLFALAHLIEIGVREFAEVVAIMGSDLSDQQALALIEWNRPVYALLDNDLAGDIGLLGRLNDEGDHQGNGLLDKLHAELPLYVPMWPEPKEDPDELTLDDVRLIMEETDIFS